MQLDLCMKCGAVVEDHPEAKAMHSNFHEDIQELIEFCQSVSNIISMKARLNDEITRLGEGTIKGPESGN